MAREKLGLAQPEFADQVGISRGRLASYEYLKAPLPCDVALRICNQFIIGERWLATGDGPMRQHLAMRGDPMVLRLPFGRAYDTALVEEATNLSEEMTKDGTLFSMSKINFWNPTNPQFYRNYLNALLDNWMEKLEAAGKGEDIGNLVGELGNQGQALFEEFLERELVHDAKTGKTSWFRKSTGKRTPVSDC